MSARRALAINHGLESPVVMTAPAQRPRHRSRKREEENRRAPPSDDSRELRVELFGGPTLLRGKEEISLSPFQSFFLSLVYAHGQRGISLSKIAWLLWESDDDRLTRQRIRQLCHTLKVKAGAVVVGRREGTMLRTCLASCDLDDLDILSLGGPGTGLDRYVGKEFLGRLNHPPTKSFEQWAHGRRTAVREEMITRLTHAWDSAEHADNWTTLATVLEALLVLRPSDALVQRSLAKTHLRLGNVREAYGAALTARSLGPNDLAGDPELRELLAGNSLGPGIVSADSTSLALVGRDRELARILDSVLNIRAPFLGLLVTGVPGIGKTRLCSEAGRALGEAGYFVLRATCGEFESTIPLNPFLDAISEGEIDRHVCRLGEPWQSVIRDLLPSRQVMAPPPTLERGAASRRLFEAFHQLLASLADERPTVLFLDDFQWADETSMAVIQFLARRWREGRIRLVLTARSTAIRSGTRVNQFLDWIRTSGWDSLELGELSLLGADELCRQSLPSVPEDVRKSILMRAAGNPLFIMELCAHHLDTGGTRADDVPPSMRQVVTSRVNQGSPKLRSAIEILAVAGPLDLSSLAQIMQTQVLTVGTLLDEGLQAGLVRKTDSQLYSVRHDILGEAIRQELSDGRLTSLHSLVARHFITTLGNEAADKIAIHCDKSGQSADALRYALLAADKAEHRGAVAEALGLLQLAQRHTTDRRLGTRLLDRMGHLQALRTQMAEAAPLLAMAATRYRALGNSGSAIRCSISRFSALSEATVYPHDRCTAALEDLAAEALEQQSDELFIEALEAQVRIFERQDRPDLVRTALERVRSAALASASPAAQARAHMLLALEIFYGDPRIALDRTAQALSIARAVDDPGLKLRAAFRRFLVLLYQARVNTPEGTGLKREILDQTQESGDLRLRHTALVNIGVWYFDIGEVESAVTFFREAEALARGLNSAPDDVNHLSNLGAAQLVTGDLKAAEQYFRQARARVTKGVRKVASHFLNAGLGLALARQGKVAEARAIAATLPRPDLWYYDPTLSALLWAELNRIDGDPCKAASILDTIAESIADRFIPQMLTLRLAQVRLLRRTDPTKARDLAVASRDLSSELGLSQRAATFGALI